jgi:hypothetical protein
MWVPPRPQPTQANSDRAGLSFLHTCGAYHASTASEGFAISLAFWSPQWAWSYRRAGGLSCFSQTAVWVTTSPMPRHGAHQGSCSVQELLHEGLEGGPDILPLKIERQRDVCRTQLRNGTYKTGRWPNHSHWSWNGLCSQGQLKHTDPKANHVPQRLWEHGPA